MTVSLGHRCNMLEYGLCENFRITECILCILLEMFGQLNKMHHMNNNVKVCILYFNL